MFYKNARVFVRISSSVKAPLKSLMAYSGRSCRTKSPAMPSIYRAQPSFPVSSTCIVMATPAQTSPMAIMKDLKPSTFEDIIAGISMYRPGPMDSIPTYVKFKHNPETITYKHPLLEPLLKNTYGVL